jgi:hypothetical protein
MSLVLRKSTLPIILIFAAVMFFTGINWGLPSRDSDPFLFGGRMPWTGKQIMDLAGAWDTSTSRGADIAMHPLTNRDKLVVLNSTDAERAEIVRRYRLYSNQPDEMITFRSLSGMKPARLDFDPRMYQYGGLWIYPIGALLRVGGALHLVTIRSDLAFYLDHPDAFSRFYLLARGYSALWGLIGVLVVRALGKELSGQAFVGTLAAAVYASLPVVIDLAHEAKPHLAGTVLTLAAILFAARYVRNGRAMHWMLTGICCGGAMGMVLTGYAAFAVIPIMNVLRGSSWGHRFKITAFAALTGIATFTLTNPYLPYNMLFHKSVLHSNVGNYGTFYQPAVSPDGIAVAARGLIDGMSVAPLIAGCAASMIVLRRKSAALLLLAVAAPVLLQFVLLASGKTAEYARFALTVDVLLSLVAAWGIDRLPITRREKSLAGVLLVAATLIFGMRYDINFLVDSRSNSTRQTAARDLQSAGDLYVFAEPAPYCLPPVNLFTRRILLEPAGGSLGVIAPDGTIVRPVDVPTTVDPLAPARVLSPISWANKPFEISKLPPVSSSATRP